MTNITFIRGYYIDKVFMTVHHNSNFVDTKNVVCKKRIFGILLYMFFLGVPYKKRQFSAYY